jgi:processive 1,2-diacylglycerol beta-glucosyltransferase
VSGRPPRVLVLTAGVGAGHEVPARVLARAIRSRRPDAHVDVVDTLDAMGRVLHRVAEDGMRRTSAGRRLHWVFDVQYVLFARLPPGRAVGRAALHRLGGPGLLAEVERRAPDVVVSTYPAATEVLGRLRRTGRLHVPAVGAITDLSSLWYWASPGIDLHLVTQPESVPEVERIAGPTRVKAVRGLYDERFLDPPSRDEARRTLELDPERPVVAVSGGGWGVGDLAGAVEVALERAGVTVLALCGSNEPLRARLAAAYPTRSVRALPFAEDMPTLLAASDVLVHSTAGLTVLEALLVGCRVVSYGWGVAHIRANDRAFRRHGLARVASGRDELRGALAAALAEPRRPLAGRFAGLPDAADLVLELASEPDSVGLDR